MKKFLCAILSIVLLFGLVACGSKSDKDKQNPQANQPTIQKEPIQSADPIGPSENETQPGTTEPVSKYKYESEHVRPVELGFDGQIKQIFNVNGANTRDYYWIITDDNRILTKPEGGSGMELDIQDDFGLRGDFDQVVQGVGQDLTSNKLIALIAGDRMYTRGNNNFCFNTIENMVSLKCTYDSATILTFDSAKDEFRYQYCYRDGTIKEYRVKVCDDKETVGGYYVGIEADIDIKQYIHALELIIDTDGNLYELAPWGERHDDEAKTMEWMIQPYQTNKEHFKNIDRYYAGWKSNAIYSELGNDKELKLMIDYDKNETLPIPLPEGYTTADIAKVYHDTEDIIVVFNDNAVYYSLDDTIDTLVHAEDLSAINNNGVLNNMFHVGESYSFLMDDGNVYKIKLS